MATDFSPPQSVDWLNQRKAAYLETHAKTRDFSFRPIQSYAPFSSLRR